MIRKGDQLKNQLFTLVLYITVIKWYVSQAQAALRLFFFYYSRSRPSYRILSSPCTCAQFRIVLAHFL